MVLAAVVTNFTGNIQWTATAGNITGVGTTVTYTVPSVNGTYTVTATAGTMTATATITVVNAPPIPTGEAISISPTAASIVAGTTLVFSATLTNTPNTTVVWTTSGGTITGNSTVGTYTAPNTPGTYTVTGSTRDGSASSSATVVVSAPGQPPPPSPVVTVSLSPATATMPAGSQATFTATVTGTSNNGMDWTATGGTINSAGLSVVYTAPSIPGTYTLTGTTQDPSAAFGDATITVVAPPPPPPPIPPVTVTVSPATATVTTSTNLILTCTVIGTSNQNVTWTTSGGTIVATGLTASLTTPGTAGTVTVVCTSTDPSHASASATITVQGNPNIQHVSITLLPTQQTMLGGSQQSFTGTVSGAIDTSVIWTTTGGTIVGGNSPTVTYTAPLVGGTYTVTATANADHSQVAFATITVPTPVITIAPASTVVGKGGIQNFTATVTNTMATGASWTATAGSFNPTTGNNVVYTAPNTAGNVTVTATSQADPSQRATATVAVVASSRPIISNVQASATTNSCTVTWNTDIGSDSLMDLGTGMGPHIPVWSQTAAATTDTTAPGVTSHTATVTGLQPGGQYTIYLRSRPFVNGIVDNGPLDAGWYDGASNCNNLHDGSDCICGNNGAITLPITQIGGSVYDFQIVLQGPTNIVQGYDGFIDINYGDTMRPTGWTASNMNILVTGLPPNVTVTTHDPSHQIASWNQNTGVLTLIPSSVGQDSALRIVTNGSTPTGTYTINFTANQLNFPAVIHSYTYTLNVIAPSFPSGFPASFPAIPGIGTMNTPNTWIWGMVQKGLLRLAACTEGVNGPSSSANFYDGIRGYQQAKAYDIANNITGNPSAWDTCIADRENGYIGYINSTTPPGAIKALLLGSKGMAVLALNGDLAAQTALFNTADNAQWRTLKPTLIDVGAERELNFTTETFIAANRAGHSNEAALIPIGITMMLDQVDQMVNAEVSHEPFLDGATADTLIHYYIDTGSTDQRVPMYIKALADHLWTRYFLPGACNVNYGFHGCFRYSAGMTEIGIDYSTNGSAYNDEDLNPMIAPMYAWLFRMTGNGTIPGSDGSQCLDGGGIPGQPCTYQQAGDTIFLNGVHGADYFQPWKDWDQAYRWSFDYVTWRSP